MPKLNVWVPNVLTDKESQNVPFLKDFINGDEKWIVYNSVKCKSKKDQSAQTNSKANIHQKK